MVEKKGAFELPGLRGQCRRHRQRRQRRFVGLSFSMQGQPRFPRFKQAWPSVLAPYAGESAYENQGRRGVVGQRLMQSSSDVFLGWTRGRYG
jgi:hypothetical protein